MDYSNLFSNNLPPDVESPEGIRAQTKYIFSVTNAVPETIATQGLSDGLQAAMSKEGLDLAGYPPPQGQLRNGGKIHPHSFEDSGQALPYPVEGEGAYRPPL